MKKSTIILLILIYVASIVFVGFFGMKMMTYNETIYVDKVECINEDMKDSSDYKYVVLNYVDGLVYQLLWKVEPETATTKAVEFVYDTESTIASVNHFGAVSFQSKGTITIQIRSTDGTNKNIKVKIIAR